MDVLRVRTVTRWEAGGGGGGHADRQRGHQRGGEWLRAGGQVLLHVARLEAEYLHATRLLGGGPGAGGRGLRPVLGGRQCDRAGAGALGPEASPVREARGVAGQRLLHLPLLGQLT